MYSVWQDCRFALRSMRKHAGLTIAAVLSLGLAIGSSATVYIWLERFVLHPLPAVDRFDRLVAVQTHAPEGRAWSLSYPCFKDWQRDARSMDLAIARFFQGGITSPEGTQRVWSQAVSGNFFDVLQVPAVLGRVLQPEDEATAAPVAVLGYSFWRGHFLGDSGVVGSTISINGHPVTIVGVAWPEFGGTVVGLAFDLYIPLTLEPSLVGRPSWLDNRGWQSYEGVGRLREGVSLAQARTELDGIALRVGQANGDTDVLGAYVNPFGDHGGPAIIRPALLALLGITGLVLLIACTNVASILLARALARRRETGLRIALGASRIRLLRQHLTESLLLAGLAGLVALVVATWGRDLMYAFVPPAPVPISFRMALNYRVIGFTAGVTLLTAVLFGLLPALQASRLDLVGSLKDEIGAGAGGRSRMLGVVIVAQIALSVVSLVAAGLFIRSLQGSNKVDVGFRDPKHVLLVTTDLTLAGYADSAAIVTMGRLLDRIRTVPGVEAAGAATMVPLGFGGGSSSTAEIEGYVPATDENLSIDRSTVTPGYFEAMEIPLVRGRAFAATDRPGFTLPVAVVNEAFAERYWPGKDPIGRRLRQGGDWLTLVGVTRQGKYQQLNEAPLPVIYQLLGQRNDLYLTTHIRTRGDPQLLTGTLRAAFAEVGRGIPFLDAHTMAEHMGAAVFAQRMAAWMLSAFGATALLLSGLGIYGMLSHLVGRRTREIGLRIALGADQGAVMGLVVGIAMRRVLIGLVVGLSLGLATGQLIRSQLLGISPRDPLVLGCITLLLGVVALVASWLPARRAARVDPMVALRTE